MAIAKPQIASAACAAQDTSRGTVTSSITVPVTGSYRVWSRILAPDATNNTFILEIDSSTCGVVVGGGSTIPAGSWTWVDFAGPTTTNKIDVSLTAGTHTMTLIGREDNVSVDRIIFTADTTCIPSGMGDNCANPPDTTPPTVSISTPTNGAAVSGTISVTANAADDVAVGKVEFYVDGVLKATDTTSAYNYGLNSATLSNGNHTIYAIAYDTAGTPNQTQSSTITVSVTNAPTCTAASSTAVTAPTGLTKSASTYTSINIGWNASVVSPGCTITGYDIYRNAAKVGTTTSLTYSDNGLVSGTNYTYTVQAKDSGPNTSAMSASVSYATVADNLAPNVPGTFTAAAPAAAAVNLSWANSTDLPNPGGVGVAGYYIYRNGSVTPTYTITNPAAVSYSDTTVAASTRYTYIISAFDANANESAPSSPVAATTAAPTCTGNPTVPTTVRSLSTTTAAITLGWNASTASAGCTLSGYHIYRSGAYIGDATTPSYVNSGLLPNASYGFTVSAFDTSAHTSAQSTNVNLATAPDTAAPIAPGTVTAVAVSSSSISLVWTAATDNVGISGYKIYRGGTLIKTSPGLGLIYTDTTVVSSTNYNYTISAYDGANNESLKTAATPSPITTPSSTDTTPPTTPTLPSVLATTNKQVSLGWATSIDNVLVTGYHLYINGIYSSDTTNNTITLSCLSPNVTYTFIIKAFDASGNLSAPSTVTAKTLAGTVGDIVCDSANLVNSSDLFTLLRNWNATTALPSNGDTDGNTKVNSIDLFALLRNWGKTT